MAPHPYSALATLLALLVYGLAYISAPQKRTAGYYLTIAPTLAMFAAVAFSTIRFLLS